VIIKIKHSTVYWSKTNIICSYNNYYIVCYYRDGILQWNCAQLGMKFHIKNLSSVNDINVEVYGGDRTKQKPPPPPQIKTVYGITIFKFMLQIVAN